MASWKSWLLPLYYYGSYPYRWWRNRWAEAEHRAPVAVLVYHRVAEEGVNEWTLSNREFTRQVRWLTDHFELVSLAEVQRLVRTGDNTRPCASITFDDGYADNCLQAIPLLIKMRIPCTYFVTVRNVLEGVPFEHDLACGYRFAPNHPDELRAMAAAGIEMGAHGYSHCDLGQVTDPRMLRREMHDAREMLTQMVGQPIRYFGFPFGQPKNVSPEAMTYARVVGYEGVCSAYGGYNFPGGDPFHIRRIPADRSMIRLKNRMTIDPRLTPIA